MVEEGVRCILCEGLCGVTRQGDRVVPMEGDPLSPGGACAAGLAAIAGAGTAERPSTPMRWEKDGWRPVPWDRALDQVGRSLADLRALHGPRSVGVALGAEAVQDADTLLTGAGLVAALGSPNLYTSATAAPLLLASEHLLGRPLPLLADLERARHVLILGGNQGSTAWGPLMRGRGWGARLSQRSRQGLARVTVLDSRPRGTPHRQVPARPGTELWFLLGACHAILKGAWYDPQYVRDWTVGLGPLERALEPWAPERCAAICGVAPDAITGEALRFSRAATAAVHCSPSALGTPWATLTAWAMMVLSSLTANTLQPGGLYVPPLPPWWEVLSHRLGTASAPRTRTGNRPLVAFQAAITGLAQDISRPGPDRVRGLLVSGMPLDACCPDPASLARALDGLDLLVTIGPRPGHRAGWFFPTLGFWEGEQRLWHLEPLTGGRDLTTGPGSPPVSPHLGRPGEALAQLVRAMGSLPWGGVHGVDLQILGRWLLRSNGRQVGVGVRHLPAALPRPGGRGPRDQLAGQVDRAAWPVSHPDGRILLSPTPFLDALGDLEPPSGEPQLPLLLRSSSRRVPASPPWVEWTGEPEAVVHPSQGGEGQRARLVSRHGEVPVRLTLDPALRPDTVELPADRAAVYQVLDPQRVDPFTGSPWLDGVPCRLALQ